MKGAPRIGIGSSQAPKDEACTFFLALKGFSHDRHYISEEQGIVSLLAFGYTCQAGALINSIHGIKDFLWEK